MHLDAHILRNLTRVGRKIAHSEVLTIQTSLSGGPPALRIKTTDQQPQKLETRLAIGHVSIWTGMVSSSYCGRAAGLCDAIYQGVETDCFNSLDIPRC